MIRVPRDTRRRTTLEILHEPGTRTVERVVLPAAVTVSVTLPEHGLERSLLEIVTRARPSTRRELTLSLKAFGVARAPSRRRPRRPAAATP